MVKKSTGSVAYPLIGIFADPGVGKSLYAVSLIRRFLAQYGETRKVFTNMLLFQTPYVEIDYKIFEDGDFTLLKYTQVICTKDPNGALSYREKDPTNPALYRTVKYTRKVLAETVPFENGLLVLDEIQEGSDAYNFMDLNVKRLNKFVSQVRKYDIDLVVISQRVNFVSKRLRILLNYHYKLDYYIYYDPEIKSNTFTPGIVKIRYWRITSEREICYKEEIKDLTGYFDFYATKQIIKGGTTDGGK